MENKHNTFHYEIQFKRNSWYAYDLFVRKYFMNFPADIPVQY